MNVPIIFGIISIEFAILFIAVPFVLSHKHREHHNTREANRYMRFSRINVVFYAILLIIGSAVLLFIENANTSL